MHIGIGVLYASSKSTKKACLRHASLNELGFSQAKHLDLRALSFKRALDNLNEHPNFQEISEINNSYSYINNTPLFHSISFSSLIFFFFLNLTNYYVASQNKKENIP